MPGITIGDGAVVGSGAIVTKDVPPYTIVVGSPAKILRRRFSQELEDKYASIKWWDWSKEKIKANFNDFLLDAESFAEKHYKG
jgi:serine acetyltransferase